MVKTKPEPAERRTETISPSPLSKEITTRSFRLRAATIDSESRSVEAVIATETPTAVYDWAKRRVIDEVLLMSGAKFPASRQVVLLDSHMRWGGIELIKGSTRELRIEGDKLIGRNFISTFEADVWTKIREGHLTDNSIGYHVLKYVDIPPGEKRTIQGREFAAGERTLRVSTQWAVKENSLTPIGADEVAKMRESERPGHSAPSKAERSSTMTPANSDFDPELVISLAGSRGLARVKAELAAIGSGWRRGQAMTRNQMTAVMVALAEFARTNGREPDEVASELHATFAVEAGEVHRAAARLGIGGNWTRADVRAIAARLEISPREAERAIFGRATDSDGNRRKGEEDDQMTTMTDDRVTRSVLRDALLVRAGLGDTIGDRRASAVRGFEKWTLRELTREWARDAGIIARREELDVTRMLSTPALVNTLCEVAQVVLSAGFAEIPQLARLWCGQMDVANFRECRAAVFGGVSDLKEVGAAGEVDTLRLGDAGEMTRLRSFCGDATLTDRQIVNGEEIDFINAIRTKLSAAAARLEMNLAVKVLQENASMSDGEALFSAAHANLAAGASSALSDTGLGILMKLMRKQRGPAGDEVPGTPRVMLVPPEIEEAAIKLNGKTVVQTIGADGQYEGRFRLIVARQLSDAKLHANASANAWYLACDPANDPAIALQFLAGSNRTPTIAQIPAKTFLGLRFRVVHDVNAVAINHRAIAKATGVAE